MKIKPLLLFVLLFLFVTCKKEEQNVLIEPEFQEYVERFFAESKERGFDLKENNLEVVFRELEDFCGLGYKKYKNTNLRRVEINPVCWERGAKNYKEYLMFHELGHAVLGRNHTNTNLPNGMRKSIMCGTGPRYEECSRGSSSPYSAYTPRLRKYYIDELFDSSIRFPQWAVYKPRVNGRIVFKEDFEGKTNWRFILTDSTKVDTYTSGINFDESTNSTVATIHPFEYAENDVLSYWFTTFLPMSITEGSIMELSVTVKTEEVEGNGISLILRTDSGNEDYVEQSGLARLTSITGTDTKRYFLAIPYYPTEVLRVNIFLYVSPYTKGKVSFDDVEVTVYDN